MTKKELKVQLDELLIPYSPRATKAELEELLSIVSEAEKTGAANLKGDEEFKELVEEVEESRYAVHYTEKGKGKVKKFVYFHEARQFALDCKSLSIRIKSL